MVYTTREIKAQTARRIMMGTRTARGIEGTNGEKNENADSADERERTVRVKPEQEQNRVIVEATTTMMVYCLHVCVHTSTNKSGGAIATTATMSRYTT